MLYLSKRSITWAKPTGRITSPSLKFSGRANWPKKWLSIWTFVITRILTPISKIPLGAGFTLATHDLEIRGAGELLGAEQSGQIHEIGFTLYTELLARAVKALREGKVADRRC